MNCKPNQMAWIVVPKDQNLFGIEQLNGHIVRTVKLLNIGGMPTWEVTPTQTVTITRDSRPVGGGEILRAGDKAICDSIPDHYLRPFDPNSEPEQGDRVESLELTS